MKLHELLKHVVDDQYGQLTKTEVAELAKLDRLRQILVRCGSGRFVCAAQCVDHYIGIITDSERDYVRDVNLLGGDAAFRGDYRAVTNDPAPTTKPVRLGTGWAGSSSDEPEEYRSHVPPFDPADCGGVFDGFGVVSDADPGL